MSEPMYTFTPENQEKIAFGNNLAAWGSFGGALVGGYTGLKNLKIAKDTFELNKQAFDLNRKNMIAEAENKNALRQHFNKNAPVIKL